jgi:glycosyltransferase involved in cell wall biosynthesis
MLSEGAQTFKTTTGSLSYSLRMRLAYFTPWPPDPSGIAGRSAELVPALAEAGHGIDVFIRDAYGGARHSDDPVAPRQVRVQSAHDFVWRAGRGHYDLAIYQIGNSHLHEYIWPYLFRWPGLPVLHDARVHHARAAAALQSHGARFNVGRYRADFAWNHPDESPDAAELAIAGFDGAYYYMWPMVRDIVAVSKTTAVHARGAAALLQAEFPGEAIEYVTLGEGSATPLTDSERQAARAALGFASEDVVFGVFGGLTAEKRILEVLRAFRACLAVQPSSRLLLAGRVHPALDWRDAADAAGVLPAVTLTEHLDDAAFDRAVAAVDVSINLRWPSALETSGPWLRALAAGRPTIVTDLAHQSHVPVLDPRTWQSAGAEPVAVAIDILDEAHSLGLALRRLATDGALRARLGAAARDYWERTHTFERMRDDYLSLIERAAARTRPPVRPPVLEYDPLSKARALTADFGTLSCELF